jgi:hypothetical protein
MKNWISRDLIRLTIRYPDAYIGRPRPTIGQALNIDWLCAILLGSGSIYLTDSPCC